MKIPTVDEMVAHYCRGIIYRNIYEYSLNTYIMDKIHEAKLDQTIEIPDLEDETIEDDLINLAKTEYLWRMFLDMFTLKLDSMKGDISRYSKISNHVFGNLTEVFSYMSDSLVYDKTMNEKAKRNFDRMLKSGIVKKMLTTKISSVNTYSLTEGYSIVTEGFFTKLKRNFLNLIGKEYNLTDDELEKVTIIFDYYSLTIYAEIFMPKVYEMVEKALGENTDPEKVKMAIHMLLDIIDTEIDIVASNLNRSVPKRKLMRYLELVFDRASMEIKQSRSRSMELFVMFSSFLHDNIKSIKRSLK